MAESQTAIQKEFTYQEGLRKIARNIVKQSKNDAEVDTGRLKRSISYVIDKQGVYTFTEVFYGQFNNNSKLEENIKEMFPKGEPYNLLYTDDNGAPYQTVKRFKSGRISQVNVVNTKARSKINETIERYKKANKINGIKDFLKKIAVNKVGTDGKENKSTD